MARKHDEPAARAFVEVDELLRLVSKQLEVPASELAPSRRFVEDLGADEAVLARLMLAIEERFDVKIDERDARELGSFGAIVRYLDDTHGRGKAP